MKTGNGNGVELGIDEMDLLNLYRRMHSAEKGLLRRIAGEFVRFTEVMEEHVAEIRRLEPADFE